MANLGSGAPIFPAWSEREGVLPFTTGLTHYYLLGESGENTRVDSVGSAHFDQVGTGMLNAAGINGNGMKFPGSVGANTENFTADPGVRGSLSLWFNTTNEQDHGLFTFKDGLDFVTDNQQVGRLVVRDGGFDWKVTTNAVVYAANGWYHFVFTWNFPAAQVKIYVNGVAKAATADNPITQSSAGEYFQLGTEEQGSSVPLNTIIDEVGVWNRVLNQAEVILLYNAGVGKFYPTF